MINQQLTDYVNQCLAAGQTKEQIKQSLLQSGWQDADVNEALGGEMVDIVAPMDFQQPKRFPTKLLAGAILAIVILAAIGGGIYWWQKNAKEKQVGVQESKEKQTIPLSTTEKVKELPNTQDKFKCELEIKDGYIIASGKVEFPRGIKNSKDYSVVILPEIYKISSNG